MGTALSLTLLVSEMQRIPMAKVEVHFLKKLAFVANNVWLKMPSENVRGQQKTFQNRQQYVNSYVHKYSRIFHKAFLVSELHRLPRCIAP